MTKFSDLFEQVHELVRREEMRSSEGQEPNSQIGTPCSNVNFGRKLQIHLHNHEAIEIGTIMYDKFYFRKINKIKANCQLKFDTPNK